jgi:polysaccharide pyruvyl transferase WcaK-like protein
LDTLEMGIQRRIPVAILSQGIGPVQDASLWAKAKVVLPRLNLILVREGRNSLDLLKQWGVQESRVFVTGDDAVELAYEGRPAGLGSAIGVNLRKAAYAGFDTQAAAIFRKVLIERAVETGVGLVGVPISRNAGESDAETLKEVFGPSASPDRWGEDLDTPRKVSLQVAQCRLVVSGSYHAGVFALAQGVPVVGIVRSAYYRDKFEGLASQFGAGCTVVSADAADFAYRLRVAIRDLWESAPALRQRLLSAAERQISQGSEGYNRLYSITCRA